ncbi:DNA internalization-related competence protein ComEC/Rec2 [Bacillus sp. 3255]|uniref:DNA internalization-related competence protein ComEC/Rec2 n=1 Tax=Bacillus sp. 3255 TaxID=2817904 RepID=UPI0028676DC0|nr:DNA internalization-related competence protein ComEC/Rec2 [Bacillus sp. 3255]MDR6880043.1 competence protein ComEC [Bacillus sp. 3255]
MKRPVVLGGCLWITGYVLALYTELPLGLSTSALLLAALAAVHLLRLPGRQLLSTLVLVGAACGYFEWTDQRNVSALPPTQRQGTADGREAQVLGRIATPVTVDGDRASFAVEADSIRFPDERAFPLGGERVQVSLRLLAQAQQGVASGWRRGDAITLAGTLRSPSPARNFGGFDYRRYLRLHHTHWLLAANGVDQAQVQPAAARFGVVQLLRWNDELRGYLSRRMDLIFPAPQAGYMKSMLIGLTDDLDPARFQQFSELGLTHLLAISGLNVAVFIGVCMWGLRRFKLTKETSMLVCLWLLPFYIGLTGASPSIVRAGGMAMIALYAAKKGWTKDVLHTIAIVGWIMLLWNPYYVLDVSFQLSFLVTLGLIVGVPRANALIERLISSNMLRNMISITFVSQLVSFPVTIYYFNQFSLLSWLANMLLVPVISLVVFPAGLAAVAAGLIWLPAGKLIGALLAGLNDAVFRLTDGLQQFAMFKQIWPSPSLAWLAVYYMLVVGLFVICHLYLQQHTDEPPIILDHRLALKKTHLQAGLGCAAAVFIVHLWIGYSPERFERSGLVQFIDVGQGDAILIRTPYGKQLLIDGGGTLRFRQASEGWKDRQDPYEVGRKLLVPLLKKRGIHKLDLLVLSHADGDHSGGLQAVAEQIPLRQFLFNGTYTPRNGMDKLFRTLDGKGVPLLAARQSDWIELDKSTRLRVLYPFRDTADIAEMVKEQNEYSVVIYLEMLGSRMLFTGDIGKATEQAIIDRLNEEPIADGEQPRIDVLKVAHHGSKHSSSQEWLDYWKPVTAVISAGVGNVYGHPAPEVIERLRLSGAHVLGTADRGEIQLEVREEGIFTRQQLAASP